MALTKIIANTPQTPNNSDAQDWASMLNAIVGDVSGVLTYGNELEVEIVNDNKIKIKDGVYSLQGHMIRIHEGTDLELTVNSGTLGVERIDLLVVTYEKNINNQEDDVFKFEVVQGDAIASNEGSPVPPNITQNNLLEGGIKRQEVLYELHLNETTLSLVDKRQFVTSIGDLENRVEDRFNATEITYGSNPNGRWIKFPDGTMMCTRSVVPNRNTTDRQYFTMPQKFTKTPYTNASHQPGDLVQYNEANNSLSVSGNTSAWTLKFVKTTDAGPDFVTQLIAIGTWK